MKIAKMGARPPPPPPLGVCGGWRPSTPPRGEPQPASTLRILNTLYCIFSFETGAGENQNASGVRVAFRYRYTKVPSRLPAPLRACQKSVAHLRIKNTDKIELPVTCSAASVLCRVT